MSGACGELEFVHTSGPGYGSDEGALACWEEFVYLSKSFQPYGQATMHHKYHFLASYCAAFHELLFGYASIQLACQVRLSCPEFHSWVSWAESADHRQQNPDERHSAYRVLQQGRQTFDMKPFYDRRKYHHNPQLMIGVQHMAIRDQQLLNCVRHRETRGPRLVIGGRRKENHTPA